MGLLLLYFFERNSFYIEIEMAKDNTANKPHHKSWVHGCCRGIVIEFIKNKTSSINKYFWVVIEKLKNKSNNVVQSDYEASFWSGKFECEVYKESGDHDDTYMREFPEYESLRRICVCSYKYSASSPYKCANTKHHPSDMHECFVFVWHQNNHHTQIGNGDDKSCKGEKRHMFILPHTISDSNFIAKVLWLLMLPILCYWVLCHQQNDCYVLRKGNSLV